MDNKNLKKSGFATKAIHGGKKPNQFGALADPIYQTSTFVFDNVEQGGRRRSMDTGTANGPLPSPSSDSKAPPPIFKHAVETQNQRQPK